MLVPSKVVSHADTESVGQPEDFARVRSAKLLGEEALAEEELAHERLARGNIAIHLHPLFGQNTGKEFRK